MLLGALAHAEQKDGGTTLSVEKAKILSQDTSGRLQLDRLTTLSPEAAKELARYDGWLLLNGFALCVVGFLPPPVIRLLRHAQLLHHLRHGLTPSQLKLVFTQLLNDLLQT